MTEVSIQAIKIKGWQVDLREGIKKRQRKRGRREKKRLREKKGRKNERKETRKSVRKERREGRRKNSYCRKTNKNIWGPLSERLCPTIFTFQKYSYEQ